MPPLVLPSAAREGQYAVLQLAWPGRAVRNIGVLIIDPATGRGWCRFAENYGEDVDAEVLEALPGDFELKLREMGGEAFFAWLEDTLSNTLRITERETVEVDAFTRVRDRLFERHVEPIAVRPFQTHLPLYSLRAAATRFGSDEVVEEEPEDWVAAPPEMRLGEGMFVARVVGRSMEPRIPDGSLNVFRAPVVGSRQGRIVLVKRPGGFEDSGGCTVKRYASVKRVTEEGWSHESIRMEPLNPEFPAFDLEPGDTVIAEWVRTLE